MKMPQWKLNTALLIGLSCLFLQSAQAADYDQIIAFGDSLSDNGNDYALTSKMNETFSSVPIIPSPPYFEGRFSNGPVWIEDLATSLNVPLNDYAYGGAWAENFSDSKLLIPFGLGSQVILYLSSAVTDFNKDNHLYVIWMGGNDYLGGRDDVNYATTNTVAVIHDAVERLIYYGAKNILVLNLPDLGLTPGVEHEGNASIKMEEELSQMHNQKLAAMISEEIKQHPDVKFTSVNVADYMDDLMADPEKYHIKNVTNACYDGNYYLEKMAKMGMMHSSAIQAAKKANIDIMHNYALRSAYAMSLAGADGVSSCDDPDEYLFWDNIHPTRTGHQLISSLVLNALKGNA